MANEFRKVTDQNGVDHPVTDDTRVTWTANGVLGAKNRFDPNKAVWGTWKYEDNSIKNVSTDTRSYLKFDVQGRKNDVYVKSLGQVDCLTTGKYTLSITIADSDDINQLWIGHSGSATNLYFRYPFTEKGSYTFSFNLTSDDPTTANGIVMQDFMITLSADTDPTYQPYAMTNRELTEKAEHRDMFLQSESGITGLNNAVTKLFELVIPYLDSNGKTADGHFLWTGNKNLSFCITRYGSTDYQGLLIDSLVSKLYVVAYNNGTVTVAEFTGTAVS